MTIPIVIFSILTARRLEGGYQNLGSTFSPYVAKERLKPMEISNGGRNFYPEDGT
jgi:hypothetical protein